MKIYEIRCDHYFNYEHDKKKFIKAKNILDALKKAIIVFNRIRKDNFEEQNLDINDITSIKLELEYKNIKLPKKENKKEDDKK